MNRKSYGRPALIAGLLLLTLAGAEHKKEANDEPVEADVVKKKTSVKPVSSSPYEGAGCLGGVILQTREQVAKADEFKVELAQQFDDLTTAFAECASEEEPLVDVDLLERDYPIWNAEGVLDEEDMIGIVTVSGPFLTHLKCSPDSRFDRCTFRFFQKATYPAGFGDEGFVNIVPEIASSEWTITCPSFSDEEGNLSVTFELGVSKGADGVSKSETANIGEGSSWEMDSHLLPEIESLIDLEDEIHPFHVDANLPQFLLPNSDDTAIPEEEFRVFLDELGLIIDDSRESDEGDYASGAGDLWDNFDAMQFNTHPRAWFGE